MVHTVFYEVELEKEKEILENYINEYQKLIECSSPNEIFQIAFYEGCIIGLKARIKHLYSAPKTKKGTILLKKSLSRNKER